MPGGRSTAEKDRLMQIDPSGRAWNEFVTFRDSLPKNKRAEEKRRMSMSHALAWARSQGLQVTPGADDDPDVAQATKGTVEGLMRPATAFDGLPDSLPRADVKWVAANIANRDAQPSDGPSKAAWGLLNWARSNFDAFYQGPYSKLLPTREQVDKEDLRNDDGSDVLDSIEFVYNAKRAALLQAGAEGHVPEFALSGGTPQVDGGEP